MYFGAFYRWVLQSVLREPDHRRRPRSAEHDEQARPELDFGALPGYLELHQKERHSGARRVVDIAFSFMLILTLMPFILLVGYFLFLIAREFI